MSSRGNILTTLSHLMPLIKNINSIQLTSMAQLSDLYNADSNSHPTMDMQKMPRILGITEYGAGVSRYIRGRGEKA
jgi:hypothetical protein